MIYTKIVGSLLKALNNLQEGKVQVVDLAKEMSDYPLDNLYAWWYQWVVDLVKIQSGVEPEFIQSESHYDVLKLIAERSEVSYMGKFLDKLNENIQAQQKSANLNPVMQLESLLFIWSKLAKS